ncbi:type II toxin-antitoxin system prevent-host-death family antitoxin [Kitasatospora sp. NPDC004531]
MDATLTMREARDRLAEVAERATHDDVTVLTRHGKEVAAVIPISMLRQYRVWEEQEDLRLVRKAMAEDGPTATLAEMMAETMARPE